MNELDKAYADGFTKVCEENGIDPDVLTKTALNDDSRWLDYGATAISPVVGNAAVGVLRAPEGRRAAGGIRGAVGGGVGALGGALAGTTGGSILGSIIGRLVSKARGKATPRFDQDPGMQTGLTVGGLTGAGLGAIIGGSEFGRKMTMGTKPKDSGKKKEKDDKKKEDSDKEKEAAHLLDQAYIAGIKQAAEAQGLDVDTILTHMGINEKQAEDQSACGLLKAAMPNMSADDLDYLEGFVKECAAQGADVEDMLKLALFGMGDMVRGIGNRIASSAPAQAIEGFGQGVGGAVKGLFQGGATGMRQGWQQGQANAAAQNSAQRQLGNAQLASAGAQRAQTGANIKGFAQDATALPGMAGAWAGGLWGGGLNAANQAAMNRMGAGTATRQQAQPAVQQAQQGVQQAQQQYAQTGAQRPVMSGGLAGMVAQNAGSAMSG